MCSIKISLNQVDGTQQTISRSAEKGGGDGTAAAELAVLRKHMGEVQTELNAALTVLVEKEKAAVVAGGKVQAVTVTDDQEDELEDEDEEEEEDDKTTGSSEPPQKIRKT